MMLLFVLAGATPVLAQETTANCNFTCYFVETSAGNQAVADARAGASGATPQQCRRPAIQALSATVANCTQSACQAACQARCASVYGTREGRCLTGNVSLNHTGDCEELTSGGGGTTQGMNPPSCGAGIQGAGGAAGAAIPSGPFDPFAGRTIPVVINQMIKFMLGFVGILAVGTFVYGGFLWMTAAGDSKQVSNATTVLRNGILGFIFVLFAYGLLSSLLGLVGALNGLPQDTTPIENTATNTAQPASGGLPGITP